VSSFANKRISGAITQVESVRQESYGGPREVEIYMVVERVVDVNTVDGTFKAQCLITYRWECPAGELGKVEKILSNPGEDDGDFEPEFEPKLRFRNYQETTIETKFYSVQRLDGKAYIEGQRRVFMVFNELLNLKQFPNDCQTLNIVLESEQSTNVVRWKHYYKRQRGEEPKKVQSGKVNIKRCDLGDFEVIEEMPYTHRMYIADHQEKMVSRIDVELKIKRTANYYLNNVALVTFILISLSFCVWGLSPEATSDRQNVFINLFLTVMAFKMVLQSLLPKVSYMTRLDRYLLGSSVFLVVMMTLQTFVPFTHFSKIEMSAITKAPDYFEAPRQEDAVRDDMTGGFLFVGFWSAWNIGFFLYCWCRSRSEYAQFLKQAQEEQSNYDNLSPEAVFVQKSSIDHASQVAVKIK
jgi:hypothetical protein